MRSNTLEAQVASAPQELQPSYRELFERSFMLPDDINAYINSVFSMAGALECMLIELREELKVYGRYRHGVKRYLKLANDAATELVEYADRATDEQSWELHVGDIDTYTIILNRKEGMITTVRTVITAAELCLELLDAANAALSSISLHSPIADFAYPKVAALLSYGRELDRELVKAKAEDNPAELELLRPSLRNVFYQLMDKRA